MCEEPILLESFPPQKRKGVKGEMSLGEKKLIRGGGLGHRGGGMGVTGRVGHKEEDWA